MLVKVTYKKITAAGIETFTEECRTIAELSKFVAFCEVNADRYVIVRFDLGGAGC